MRTGKLQYITSALIALLAVLVIGLITPTSSRAQTATPTATPTATAAPTPPWLGANPKPGQIALLVTSRSTSPAELIPAFDAKGCNAALLAITDSAGVWSVYVVGGPAFVNAPFPASLAANAAFFVRCLPANSASLQQAPIESVTILRTDDTAPIYSVSIVSGLPGGCAKFERIDTVQSGTVTDLTVWNTNDVPPGGACTAIYGTTVHTVSLGALIDGTEYIVRVNGAVTKFTAGSTIPYVSPQPPTGVHLTGALPDISTPVPAGQGEQGRVTVLWTAPTSGQVDGYHVYNTDCAGNHGAALEFGPTDTQYGPLQPCRPGGNIGVASTFHGRESTIIWVRPMPATTTP